MLRLSRAWIICGVPLAVAIILLLTWMYRLVAHSDIEHYSEKSNIVLARTIANELWPQIDGLVKAMQDNPGDNKDWLRMIQLILDETIVRLTSNTNVLAVELHSADAYTVYSSIKWPGKAGPAKAQYIYRTIEGDTPTQVEFHENFSMRSREVQERYILSSFLPVVDNNGKVSAVFEVYSDVTDLYDKVKDSQFKFAGVLAGVFLAIYFIVYFLIRYLDNTIHRNIALGVAMDSEKKANFAKTQFLANMSHELRTPLNAIIGYSEMLHEESVLIQDLESSRDLEKIDLAAKHLLHLINEILDLSKIEAGQMTLYFEPVNVVDMVKEILQIIRPLVSEKQNQIRFHCNMDSAMVLTDALKLRQILFNLLSNASKFTQEGMLELELSHPDGQLQLSVKDNGIGMTQEQLSHLFKPFVQADESTTRRYGGTGLGLTISKQYCEMMGGSISVKSEPGQGSQFMVSIPVQDVSGQDEKSQGQRKRA